MVSISNVGRGRPTAYTDEIADKVCLELATTDRSLNKICQDEDMPSKATVYYWISKYRYFLDKYVRAREFQTETLYDDLTDIAAAPLVDENGYPLSGPMAMAEVQRRKLVCDGIKFKLAKLQPKRFGDNKNVALDVNVRHNVTQDQFDQLLAASVNAARIDAPDDDEDNGAWEEGEVL